LSFALLVIGVLLFSGIMSGAEASLLSITPAEVEDLVHKKKFGSKTLRKLRKKQSQAITAIVVLNNAINIVGSILVGRSAMALYGDQFLALVTTLLTFSVIIFSEIIPKSIGINHAHLMAPLFAPLILAFTYILMPVIVIMEFVTKVFNKGERKIGTESQIRSLVRMGWRRGHIEDDEGILIHRVFMLNDKKAEDIMVPFEKMVSFEENETVEKIAPLMMESSFSRFPVYDDEETKIKGMVLRTDVIEALARDQHSKKIKELIRPILIIRPTSSADDLLLLFKQKRTHMAIVKDNLKTVGLLTLSDILEELVGEIIDEKEAETLKRKQSHRKKHL